jgi:hypothetical protein
MGKYTSSSRRPEPIRRDRMPPLMRGIGCILFVLVPFVAYGIAIELVKYGVQRAWPIPPGWFNPVAIPAFIVNNPYLRPIGDFIASQQNLTANLVFAIALSVLMFGFMSVLYGYIYAMVGPSQYGPMDVPPPRVKTKKYKR